MAATDLQKLNWERYAAILCEAIYSTDDEVAAKWGITSRSIRGYKLLAREDPEFASYFHNKRRMFELNWADDIPHALRKLVAWSITTVSELPHTPENMAIVNATMKQLTEIATIKAFLDMKMGLLDEPGND